MSSPARLNFIAAYLVTAVACSSSRTPEADGLDAADADAAAPDASADGGDSGRVDKSKLGATCEKLDDCPSGQRCVAFGTIDPSITEPHCVQDDVCALVTCPAGTSCAVFGSAAPASAACEKP